MHPALFIFIILFSGFLSLFKYVDGLLRTPQGSIFLGTVHHSTDYFIYLSEFAQGRENWFFSSVLQSQDVQNPSLVRFTNVFLGRIFSLIGLGPVESYALSVFLLTLFLVYVSYLLLVETVVKKTAPLALILYLTGNTFWAAARGSDGWQFGTADYWYNNGNPFNRIITIPHHLVGQISTEILILVTIWWISGKFSGRKKTALLILPVLASLALAGINAVHLALIAGVGGLSVFLWFIFKRDTPYPVKLKKIIYSLFPLIVSVFAALPVIFHLKQVLSVPPYSQMIFWEANHQLYLNFRQFIDGYGPIIYLVPVGMLLFLRTRSLPRTIALNLTVACILIYFSRIPEMLVLGKVRFLPPILYLYLCAFTATALTEISRRIPRLRKIFILIVGTAYIILTVPTYLIQIKTMHEQYLDPANAYFYLPEAYVKLMREGRDISTINDTFLIPWPYASPFPALTGRRVYFSEPLLANNANTKAYLAHNFFFGNLTTGEKTGFLKDNKISYIICLVASLPPDISQVLTKIDEKNGMGLWKVNKF
jgi:hypothetical protein